MEAPRICLTSLRHAVKEFVAAGGSKRAVSVTSVRVEDAPALLSFLSLEASASKWVVRNKRRLKRLVITADLLTIIGSALVPIVADDPTSKRARDELRRYAMRVRDSACMVGASFCKEAWVVADRVLNYVNQARLPDALPSSLAHLADGIQSLIEPFKRSELTLSPEDEQRDGYGDGEEEEDDDEEGEEELEDDDDRDRPPPCGPQRLRGPNLLPQCGVDTVVHATSLKTAVEAVLDAGGSSRFVEVWSVHLRHATALQELLRFEDMRHGWNVLNPDNTNAVILMDNTLRLISAGVLPGLAEDPTDDRYLQMLRGCTHKLQGYAQSAVGCSVGTDVIALADLLLEHIGDAHRQPPVAESSLVAKSKGLITRIATLRSQQVTLYPEPAVPIHV